MKNELLPAQQGYDRAITVFSPDGRLYQVEYALETVRRGTIAVGVKAKEGIVITVEEKPRKLQISETAQKIFQVDDHIGVAAAGYIPDARSQVDNARFFSQSNKLIYAEPVDVETVVKHLADQCQQFTQYAGVRPFGVALIIGGIDNNNQTQLFLTDPSGTYISYDAVSIGSGSDQVTEFLEKNYKADFSIEIVGKGHDDLLLDDSNDIVLRKSEFICPRTLAISCDKSSVSIPRDMVQLLNDPNTKGTFLIEV